MTTIKKFQKERAATIALSLAKAAIKDAEFLINYIEGTRDVGVAPKEGTKSKVLNRSTILNPCAKVWEIASKKTHNAKGATRKNVIAACLKAGITYGTASTQYNKWLRSL